MRGEPREEEALPPSSFSCTVMWWPTWLRISALAAAEADRQVMTAEEEEEEKQEEAYSPMPPSISRSYHTRTHGRVQRCLALSLRVLLFERVCVRWCMHSVVELRKRIFFLRRRLRRESLFHSPPPFSASDDDDCTIFFSSFFAFSKISPVVVATAFFLSRLTPQTL